MASNTEYDFVETPPEEYFCPVTFELLKDPQKTNSCCGHHLSRAAAEQLEAEGKSCPLCEKKPLKTAEDLFFKRKVLQLKIRCSNKPQGCQWVGELGDLDRHLKLGSVDGECKFVEVECPLKCDKRIKRRELEKHQSIGCPKRGFFCMHCGFKSTYEGVTADHYPKCQRYPEICPNRCSQKIIERRFLQRHLKEDCQLQEIECPLKCYKCIQRCDLVNHQSNECPKRAFTCKHCGFKSTYEGVTADHWPKCQRCPVICPNKCSEGAIERCFLQRHLKEECPLQEIECELSYAGCTAKVKRSEMKEHMDSSKDEHFHKAIAHGKTMKAELETLALAFAKFVSKPFFVPPPEMVLDNFEKYKNENEKWYSSPFYTHIGGYKMCLSIDANGWGYGENTDVGLSVCMMRGEFDSHLRWPFKGEIAVQLVNQKEGGKHYESKAVTASSSTTDGYNDVFCQCTECDRSKTGWGLGQFISHDDLYKPEEGKEYLKNDTLKFRVTNIVVMH